MLILFIAWNGVLTLGIEQYKFFLISYHKRHVKDKKMFKTHQIFILRDLSRIEL